MKRIIAFIYISFLSLFLSFSQAEEVIPLPFKIMPLGDSLTYDYRISDSDNPRPTSIRTAYRSHLWYMLQERNVTVDFVGSQVAGEDILPAFDPDNEGHRGWTSHEIAENTYTYMAQSIPDTVLLHIGTNDLSSSVSGVSSILNEIDAYEQISGHSIRVHVALILDTQTPNGIISIFNQNLKDLIISRMVAGDNINLVDMYRGAGLTPDDYIDELHPNDIGYYKMARVWYNALFTPYNLALNQFPGTLVPAAYIESLYTDTQNGTVEFITEVPDTGITF